MNRSDNIADLAAALAKAQSAIEGARKGNVNPAFRSKYADLGAVWDAIRDPMTANGLAVLQQLGTDENRVSCTTLLTHATGQWIEFAPFTVPVTKQDAQGYGSAATYARRYSLMAAVGIAPIDDDGEAAVGRSNAAPPVDIDALLPKAREAAMQGAEAFRAFWRAASNGERSVLRPHIPALEAAAKAAEKEPA